MEVKKNHEKYSAISQSRAARASATLFGGLNIAGKANNYVG